MEKEPKLSHKERKALLAAQKIDAQKKARRNTLTGVSAAVAALALTTVGIGGYYASRQNQATPTPTSSPELYGKDAWKVIKQKIKELDLKGSQTETDLWNGIYAYYPTKIPETQEERDAATKEVIIQTIDAMRRSENPKFNEAYKTINTQIVKGDLNFDLIDLGSAYAKTGPISDLNNNLIWNISFNADKILTDMSPVVLALVITHEAVHLEKGLELRNLHSNISPTEFANFDSDYYSNAKNRLSEEALAYATAGEAFMYNASLQTMEVTEDFTPMLDAANLIRCNMIELSSCWQGYINSNSERILGE